MLLAIPAVRTCGSTRKTALEKNVVSTIFHSALGGRSQLTEELVR